MPDQSAIPIGGASTIIESIIVTVADAQAIDIRWRVSAGTGTMGDRILTLLKVA